MSNKNKLTAVFITILLIISQFAVFSSVSAVETTQIGTERRAVDYLSLLGIIGGEDITEYMSENTISKGEAAYLLIKSIGLLEITDQLGIYTGFSDLTSEEQYSKVVTVAVNQGILAGNADTTVTLGNSITIEQAAKMIVAALGYQEPAMYAGGYPSGYLTIANRIGVLKNISVAGGVPITKKVFARMLYNAFDAKLFEYGYESDDTLEDKFLDANDLVIRDGIVEATKETSLFGSENLRDGYAIIGGKKVHSDELNLSGFIGYHVQYISDIDTDEILRFCVSKKNIITHIDKNEYPVYDNGRISYEDKETGRQDHLSLSTSDVVYLYNNRRLNAVASTKLDFSDADLILIDNDDDGEIEVVCWKKSKSAVVSGINVAAELIYLEDDNTELGASVDLDDEKGKKKIVVRTIDGKVIDWRGIQPDDAISVIESEDKLYLEIIKLPEPFSGVPTEIIEDDSVLIDDEWYNTVSRLTDLEIGKRGLFYTNENGAVFKVEYGVSDYVYIIAKSKAKSSITSDVKIKVYDNFSGLCVYDVKDKVNIDGKWIESDKVYDAITTDIVANVNVDENGKVKKITTAAKFGGEAVRKYCKYASAFNKGRTADETGRPSDIIDDEPFKFDKNTLFFAVPKDMADEDFGAIINFKDQTDYTTQAYELDTDTGCVKAIVVKFSMADFSQDDMKYGIVSKVTKALGGGDNNEVLSYIEGCSDGAEFKYAVSEDSGISDVADSLQEGDIIGFTQNYSDEIVQLELVASLKTQNEPIALASNAAGSFFGKVMFLTKSAITDDEKYLYHKLNVSATGSYGDLADMKICAHLTNTENDFYQFNNYYIYDRKKKTIVPASIDDVVSYDKSTTGASTIYLYNATTTNGVAAKILVLVED